MSLDTGVTLTMSDLITLFPTPVYRFSMAGHRKFKQTIVPKLLDTFKKEPDRKAPWAKLCNTWQIHLAEINPKTLTLFRQTYNLLLKHILLIYRYHLLVMSIMVG